MLICPYSLCADIIRSYTLLDEETQQRNIVAWRPVVIDVLEGYTGFQRESFDKHIETFYPLAVALLEKEVGTELRAALWGIFRKVGETKFGMPKAHLLTKYQLDTEIALARAEYLTTTSLTTLQAFVIYLSILPHVGAGQMAANLTGVLVKLAISLGLHQDGSYDEKTAPGEVELRRRLWWQVCFLDARSKHPRFPCSMITEDMFDTALPSYSEELDDIASTRSGDSSSAGAPTTGLSRASSSSPLAAARGTSLPAVRVPHHPPRCSSS